MNKKIKNILKVDIWKEGLIRSDKWVPVFWLEKGENITIEINIISIKIKELSNFMKRNGYYTQDLKGKYILGIDLRKKDPFSDSRRILRNNKFYKEEGGVSYIEKEYLIKTYKKKGEYLVVCFNIVDYENKEKKDPESYIGSFCNFWYVWTLNFTRINGKIVQG